MNNLSRKITILLACLILILSFAACNNESKTPGSIVSSETESQPQTTYDFNGITITIADTWGRDLTPGNDERTDRLIEKIESAQQQLNVNIVWEKIDAGPYWDNMATTILAGQPFGDIMFSFPWMINGWIKAGATKEVGNLDVVDFFDGSWNEFIVSEATYNGKIFGFSKLPLNIQSGLLYNKRLFRENGLTDPNELAGQGRWDFNTLEEYAKQLTKTGSDGANTTWGLSSMDNHWLMTTFIIANGGRIIDFSQSPPKFVMDEPKSLQALEVYNRMLNIDKTILIRPMGGNWQLNPQAFANGQVGMMRIEQWVIEYVRDLMMENGSEEDYGLTYFPQGPGADGFVDETFGGNIYFIPASSDNERAKAALLVYDALFEMHDPSISFEESTRNIAESLFNDEESVEVYVDIIVNRRSISNGVSKVNLREGIMELAGYIIDQMGTPQSIIAQMKPSFQATIDDSVLGQE